MLPGLTAMTEHRIYCVSKVRWAPVWWKLRDAHSIPVVSTWIDIGWAPISDWGAFWERCLEEASTATCALVYLAPGEQLVGGMAEIGAVLSHGGSALVYGSHGQLRTLAAHPRVRCRAILADFTTHPDARSLPERWLFELAKMVDA
jgi:hypothetical protein